MKKVTLLVLVVNLLLGVQFWVYPDAQRTFYYWVDQECPEQIPVWQRIALGDWCPCMGGEMRPDREVHKNPANYKAKKYRIRTESMDRTWELNEVIKVPENVWRVRVYYDRWEYDEKT